MLNEYEGYVWGWITDDGERQKSGPDGSALPADIIGVWGKVFRDNVKEHFYFETFLSEFAKDTTEKSSWSERPLNTLLYLNRQKCLKGAYPEDYPIADEMMALPEFEVKRFKVLQLWKCNKCGHTFYTSVLPKESILTKLLRVGRLEFVRIKCEVCEKTAAKRVKRIKKEIKQ